MSSLGILASEDELEWLDKSGDEFPRIPALGLDLEPRWDPGGAFPLRPLLLDVVEERDPSVGLRFRPG